MVTKIFGRLYCRHVITGGAAEEGGAACLFLEV